MTLENFIQTLHTVEIKNIYIYYIGINITFIVYICVCVRSGSRVKKSQQFAFSERLKAIQNNKLLIIIGGSKITP